MRLKHDYNFHGEAENKGGKMHGYQGHVRSDTCKKWNFKVETKLLYENMSIEFHILKEFLTVIESVELRYAIIIGNFLQKDPCCGLKKNTPSYISFLINF